MAVINGTALYVKLSGVLVAAATGYTLTINQNVIDSTTKDSSKWAENLNGTRSWSISVDFLYDPAGTLNFVELIDFLIADVANLAVIAGDDVTVGEVNYTGTARIEAISITPNDNDASGGSVNLVGNGPLVKATVSA